MRFNRIRRNLAQINIKKNNKILFFIVLPVMAIVFGYSLSRFIIIPAYYSDFYAINSKEKASTEKTSTEKTATSHVEYVHAEREVQYFQLGSFSTRENAEVFCNDLKKKDIPCIIREEKKFLVLTGGALEDSTANRVKKQLDDQSIEFFSKTMKLASWNTTFTQNEEKVKLEKQISAIYDWLDKSLEYIWKNERKDGDKEEFLNSIEKLRKEMQVEISFASDNKQWDQFTKGLDKDLKSIEQQSEDLHKVYQSYDKIFESLVKVYNSF
ncbi:hypothetical protein NSA47_12935 [Irregularibacter muris]|uniref:SPOR domain-containing protein n=1 Tax=Irregularibacter muris TaxID=1796619 RepID=A0AAE3HFZ7_9FIRM|nr:SPOR domain-containing protein [Irregularibacter muris]MCR1899877.1 hypothetical protein [Irregularibacter muris]